MSEPRPSIFYIDLLRFVAAIAVPVISLFTLVLALGVTVILAKLPIIRRVVP